MPVYQASSRGTGTRLDAEDVTTWVFVNAFGRLALPRPVPAVDDELIEATVQAIGRHWRERYGISSPRWSALHAGEIAPPRRAILSLRGLLGPLPGEPPPLTVLTVLPRPPGNQIPAPLP